MVGRRSIGKKLDSPSRQLVYDLAKDLQAIRLHHEDLKRVYEYRAHALEQEEDEIDRVHQDFYYAAIDKTYDYYDGHRREAEIVLQEHLREEEEKERRRQEEERRRQAEKERLERERKEREEAERKKAEEARWEAERLAREETERRQAAEAEAKARKAAEEEKLRREREEAEAKERQRQQDLQKAEEEEIRRQTLGAGGGISQEEVKEQERYLELHKYMKELRRFVLAEGKKDPALKSTVGDHRRAITKCLGQLREGQGTAANKGQVTEIRDILRKSQDIPIPCDVRRFFVHAPEEITNLPEDKAKVSAVFVYLLNIFVKAVVSQLINEAGIKLEYAEPLGVVVAQIFSTEQFCFQGHAFSDIFWAKYRASCPALWGFYGDEKTVAGKEALGWKRVEPGGPFLQEIDHRQRMVGLGGGFAAVTLRNFGKTNRKNPFPNYLFWRAVAKLVSIPPGKLQETHFYILYAMLRFSADRIIGFWGHAGLGLLRNAIVDLPNRAINKQGGAIGQLKVLRGLYSTEKSILI
ncbi:RNA export mediator Gle1, putative [Talaromyces stipitatus ATCC 10500]|uniref:mRNA export factor GLE1 n=1 Tax=Talaromyces stipitatus (strain ATCC 10500 / CBS 375.48 / QM 6759 / NRRL 1006) TaxID=441959 RepID=B8LVP6_TALSN|nr:RNA export mediator Gle1, putative [Talaromyces stipitatus ATCC 10500]EED24176.1 RNA export mediator Gle1, putative [Talaromyces stipitatus ATCC 10500]